MLNLSNVDSFYGRIQALRGVSLHVEAGEVVAIIGANGAGKTTLLRTISGLVPARAGRVTFEGQDVTNAAPPKLVRLGIAQVPEGRQVFAALPVSVNLSLGAITRRSAAEIREDLERVLALFPLLRERLKQDAGTLSGGEQQMLAIGRALMSRPRLLLLDEPSMGLAPLVIDKIFDVIAELNRQGLTILLVEQDAGFALNIANRGYVMATGKVLLEDQADRLITNDEVQRIYFGQRRAVS